MRFLVDNALSPDLAIRLQQAGHDGLHVRGIGLHGSDDEVILDHAAADDRIVVSADTDFGTLLATRSASKPSVILFRKNSEPTDMRKDPILEEIHAIRRALAKECHDDISEIITHLQKRSRGAARKTVTLRPKRVAKPATRTRPRRRRTA
ncbi:MAG: hypothetical protein A3H96_05560 [Acidobacteria bacterium RIFCSPLOWO2_02_FULL_67_36]|nr:MAG: hypothetical protein A3H96_05560 [Acidobacteria bacterium RIFCSPLOWO2_02_FULL_67_36]OFW21707.1 MAG: hypothetical protein A3G21_15045 [Acidobacteria bacterium RIFCSPLOWO2_12_FULL_66_21]